MKGSKTFLKIFHNKILPLIKDDSLKGTYYTDRIDEELSKQFDPKYDWNKKEGYNIETFTGLTFILDLSLSDEETLNPHESIDKVFFNSAADLIQVTCEMIKYMYIIQKKAGNWGVKIIHEIELPVSCNKKHELLCSKKAGKEGFFQLHYTNTTFPYINKRLELVSAERDEYKQHPSLSKVYFNHIKKHQALSADLVMHTILNNLAFRFTKEEIRRTFKHNLLFSIAIRYDETPRIDNDYYESEFKNSICAGVVNNCTRAIYRMLTKHVPQHIPEYEYYSFFTLNVGMSRA